MNLGISLLFSNLNVFLFVCFVLFLAMVHVGILVPDQGLNLCPLQWKCGVLTTGLPGKSQMFLFFSFFFKWALNSEI